MSPRWTLSLVALAGCFFSRYEPGSLRARPESRLAQTLTVGCLDVAMTPTTDARVPAEHPVIRFAFGNRCDRAIALDFRNLQAVGLYGSDRVPLYVSDPRNEIRASALDAHAEAAETFEFAPRVPHESAPSSVCVTLASITPADVTPERTTRCIVAPVSLARSSEGVPP